MWHRSQPLWDLDGIYDALERDLEGRDFVCGDLSIADLALFPHLAAVRVLGVAFSRQRHPRIAAWLKRMRGIEACRAYLARARACITDLGARNLERSKIFGRGDRIEWVVARDHDGFMQEITEGRVLWPGLGVPGAARLTGYSQDQRETSEVASAAAAYMRRD